MDEAFVQGFYAEATRGCCGSCLSSEETKTVSNVFVVCGSSQAMRHKQTVTLTVWKRASHMEYLSVCIAAMEDDCHAAI